MTKLFTLVCRTDFIWKNLFFLVIQSRGKLAWLLMWLFPYMWFFLCPLSSSLSFFICFQWLWKCQLDLQLWILQISHYSDWDLEGTTGTWSCSHLPRWLALHASTHSLWGCVDLDCYKLLLYVYAVIWLMYYTFIHWHIWSFIPGSRFMCLYTAGLSGCTSRQRP